MCFLLCEWGAYKFAIKTSKLLEFIWINLIITALYYFLPQFFSFYVTLDSLKVLLETYYGTR